MAKPTKVNPPFVVVIWKDAWSDAVASTSLKDAHELHRPTVMETRGWCLVDNEEGLSVFPERCLDLGDEVYRGRTFIPRSLVKSVTPVTLKTPRKSHEKVSPQSPLDPPGI